MSLDINQIALHQLIKRDEQNLELVLRDSLLAPPAPAVVLVAVLQRANKKFEVFWRCECG